MRAILQRVTKASVSIDGSVVSAIEKGLCVLVGINRHDAAVDTEFITRKILNLRIFDDPSTGKKWDKSAKDLGLEILCVSQFTLYGQLKGNKVDYHNAMAPAEAEQFYNGFLEELRKAYQPDKVKDGRFGAHMSVSIENDGPVTVALDSQHKDR